MQGVGGWNFMSFCQAQGTIGDTACNQPYTAAGKALNGSQLAVSPSYQLTYGSESFQSAGIWQGTTFRQQFMTVLSVWLC